jgi:hypothetical protein
VVALGEPLRKGKHLPRKAKKVYMKQLAKAASVVESRGALGHTQRDGDMAKMRINVENTLSSVGSPCEAGAYTRPHLSST